jgi:hypothetical protein
MIRILACCVLLFAGAGTPLGAQQPSDLSRVRALVEEHRYDEARALLDRWWETSGPRAQAGRRAEALYLRAVLAADPEAAERDYLRLAIEHPQAPHAQEALLRLGQARVMRADWPGAGTYLRRLVADYPEGSHLPVAQLWLARVERADGRGAAACHLLRQSLSSTRVDDPLRNELTTELEGCAAPDTPGRPSSMILSAHGFRTTRDAERVRDELRFAGHRAFLFRPDGSSATHLRIDTADGELAGRIAAALREQGFVVSIEKGEP